MLRLANGKNAVSIIDASLERLIIQALKKRQADRCACMAHLSKGYQVTHQRYGLDITLDDLSLKCGKCHAIESGTRTIKGLLRKDYLRV